MPNHSFILNGGRVNVECPSDVRLLWVLRDLLEVHGPKYGCGLMVCKACTCLINGQAHQICGIPVGQLKRTDEVVTIEGLPATVGADLHPMQQAWLDYDVAQCGYCQPGQIMDAVGLVNEAHAAGRTITEADLDLFRNECRCGTYFRIREAIMSVAPRPGCPEATGRLHGDTLGLIRLGMTRAQARHAYTKSSNRHKRYEDFFCVTPVGVRVGYASPALLKTLPEDERSRYAGRVVWASTSNRIYSLDGVRAGDTLADARRRLKLTGPFDIGLNDWYLAPNGPSTAVLKVRHGGVEEIGIGEKSLLQGHKAHVAFLNSFS